MAAISHLQPAKTKGRLNVIELSAAFSQAKWRISAANRIALAAQKNRNLVFGECGHENNIRHELNQSNAPIVD